MFISNVMAKSLKYIIFYLYFIFVSFFLVYFVNSFLNSSLLSQCLVNLVYMNATSVSVLNGTILLLFPSFQEITKGFSVMSKHLE